MRTLISIILAVMLAATTAGAATIELANGDKFEAEVLEETETTMVVEHPVFGRMEVPKDSLKPPKPVEPGLFGTWFLRGFNRKAAFGLSGASGNSENLAFNAALTIQRDTDRYRSFFDAGYFFSQQRVLRANPVLLAQGFQVVEVSDEKNSNSAFVAYLHDFKLPSLPLYVFTKTRYQYDEFQVWKNRVSLSLGPGWDVIKRDKYDFRLELGAGGARTFGCEGQIRVLSPFEIVKPCEGFNRWTPEGVLGAVLGWRPLAGHSFTADSTYFPELTDWSQARVLTNAAYSIAITGIDGLSLKVGVNHEYLTDPGTLLVLDGTSLLRPVSLKQNNLKYFLNIGYEF